MKSISSIFTSIEQAYRKTEAAFRSLSENSVDAEAVVSGCMEQFDGLFLERGSEISLSAYFRYLLSKEETLRDTPFNFMLAEDEYADDICMAFFQALRIITGSEQKVLTVDERSLLQAPDEELGKLGTCSVYVIQNCSETPMSSAEATAWQQTAELFERTPCIVKILRAPKDVIESRFREFDHIYYRVFRNKLSCRAASTKDVELSLNRVLEAKGFSRTPEFETGLHTYLDVVYPKADLKNRAFVKDMVEQITSKYYERQRDGLVLDADCVPFYRRSAADKPKQDSPSVPVKLLASEALNTPEKPTAEETASIQEKPSVPQSVTAEPIVSLPPQETVQETVDEYVEDDQKKYPKINNILIVSLSTFPIGREGAPSRLSSCKFSYGDAEQREYYFQQEPFPMHLNKELKDAGEILMLTTRETRIPVQIEVNGKQQTVSPQAYFMSAVRGIEGLGNIVFKSVDVDQEKPAIAVSNVVEHLRMVKNNKVKNNNEDPPHIYLGTNGGLRGIQLILEAILSLLNSDGIYVNSEDVWSLRQVGRNRNEYAIYNSAAEFRIFDLVSGINEFQNYGRIQSLERFIAATGDETAGNLLECLKKVSEGIQYCSIKFFNEGLDRLSDFYKPNPVSEDRYIQMFLDSIKNDFETLLSNNRDILDEIKWCVRKGFFQQAFTLIENSMPDEYYKAGMISISSKLRKKAKACSARKRDSVPVFLFNYVVNNQFTAQIHDKVYDDELDELKELKELKEPRFYQINNRTGTCEVKFEINVEEASDLWTDVKLLLVAHKKVKDIRNDLMHGHEEDVKGVKPEDRHTIKNYRSRLEEYIQAADKIIGIWKGTKESIWKDRDKRPAALALSLSSSTKKETVAGTTVPPSAEAATPPGDGLQRLSKGTVLQGAEVKKVKGADVFFFLPGVESDGHCRMPDGMVLSPGELVDISIRYYNEKYHNYDVNVLQR